VQAGLKAVSVVAALALVAAACGSKMTSSPVPGGDPSVGKKRIEFYGCGACHTIGGVPQANATVGPDLRHFAKQRFLSTPRAVVLFIQMPQAIAPGGKMPDLGVPQMDAADIAAYLYTQ
jgi:cytochrome c